ncbi:DUF2852 domain-containing protein [Tritonibacter horizontis]|uniref:DUF2852 domain-containing protein n=1 Tax=Tritonibacter horizontis TaxID=1768241 RepID=A0A132BV85_9RHOB|nr:DUF2852 domain-containing protein [Tritonibacter horizontis]KUP92291.1 hypothetical protein TRIHO_29330 [Tritonibacter horizontis]
MTSYTTNLPPAPQQGWLAKGEAWLDAKGKGAWIAAMVLGFVFFWPIGLAFLAYMIWSKRMFKSHCRSRSTHMHRGFHAMKSSGNTAFDAYKADTLARLEQEQTDFESFLARLRAAKDKAEFDEFMDERVRRGDYEAADSDTDHDETSNRAPGQA